MTIYSKRKAAIGAIVTIIVVAVIIILASIPAKASGTECKLLGSAWNASGAKAETYAIKAYWKYAGEKNDTTISQMVKDMADGLGLKADTVQYTLPEKSETELHGKMNDLNVAICTTYLTDKQNLVLLCAIGANADEAAVGKAEDLLGKVLQYKPGADIYRQLSGKADKMTRMDMTNICDKVFTAIAATNIQGSFGDNYISSFAYDPKEPVYLTNNSQRCNVQIAMRQDTGGKTNVIMGFPAILEGY